MILRVKDLFRDPGRGSDYSWSRKIERVVISELVATIRPEPKPEPGPVLDPMLEEIPDNIAENK